MKALVLGATGFLGSNLVRWLNENRHDVAVWRRPSSSLKNLADCRIEDHVGEFSDLNGLEQVAKTCQGVFNLAACTSLMRRDAAEREKMNIRWVEELTGTLLKLKETVRLIHCSTVGAVGFSTNPQVMDESTVFNAQDIHYFWTKKRGEEIVSEAVKSGLDAVIVNPGTVFGPRGMRGVQKDAFLKVASGTMRVYPPGGTCLSYAPDVVRGMFLAAEKGKTGERYILGGTNLTFKEYFGKIAKAGGVSSPTVCLPRWAVLGAGYVLEQVSGTTGADTGKLAAGFGYYSSQKAERILGYSVTPIDEAIRRTREQLC